jgi:hypothetical protein
MNAFGKVREREEAGIMPSLNEVRSQGTAHSSHHNAAASQTIFAILSSWGKMNF